MRMFGGTLWRGSCGGFATRCGGCSVERCGVVVAADFRRNGV